MPKNKKTSSKKPRKATNRSFSRFNFGSRTRMLVFILIFAAVGSIVVYKSFAYTRSSKPAKFVVATSGLPKGTNLPIRASGHDIGGCGSRLDMKAGSKKVCSSGLVKGTKNVYHPIGASTGKASITYPLKITTTKKATYALKWAIRRGNGKAVSYIYGNSYSGIHIPAGNEETLTLYYQCSANCKK